ncbi:conserved hypothetical protein [Catenulispora acidiphila DSM 44928]|uniref:Uncharacterized protein n=1 Tax=Catenulispora acidiphila (strain DSM 44928 / JCM 14897 / NBRC 102108 / NRRL B-24433 / ID139908) TaxID=479433 RepID=C7QI43_CATAD|nr:hypothetical protein [Catenulispora acidiphila]ACU73088.1 conserved hypothetical protein [Catenulispora acidiphila DSM 44928]
MRTDVLPGQANPPGSRGGPESAAALESALVLHYPRLVRLAYMALPGEGERHHRALTAHGIVQNTLPRTELPPALRSLTARLPIPKPRRRTRHVPGVANDAATDAAYSTLRLAVLREVLWAPRRRWPGFLALVLRPRVWGLRLFPVGGGSEELRLASALRDADPVARAAYVLLTLEGLTNRQAEAELAAAGAENCRSGVAAGQRMALMYPAQVALSGEFDPCTLRTGPVDLPRRRRRIRLAAAVLACGVLGAGTAFAVSLVGSGGGDGHPGAAATPSVVATPHGTVTLASVPADLWLHTARLDFSAWSDRSQSGADGAAVDQALAAWTGSEPGVAQAGPGTSAEAPVAPVRLLWNGRLDGATVVLLADATRLARYTRPDHPSAADPVRLDVARADDSDVTSAGAVLLRSTAAGDRWLVAPWVVEVTTRDFRQPNTLARTVGVVNGVTAEVPRPPASGCASWPALQLRSSPLVAEHHAFLLTDLGGVTGAHLTFTPAPSHAAAQSPREATGSDALVALSRLACGLPALRNQDTKQVNTWEFALQPLPQGQGTATWVCTRADHWDGTGSTATEFLAPGSAPAEQTGAQAQGRACSRFSQHIVADTRWRSPQGKQYLLVAGSRHVTSVQVGSATVAVPDHTAALPGAGASPTITGVLDIGGTVSPLAR